MQSDRRLRAVAFPEHLETNAHLHVSADLTFALSRLDEAGTKEAIRTSWLQANKGAGSIDLDLIKDSGWSGYQTKALRGSDYFLSADFFPH